MRTALAALVLLCALPTLAQRRHPKPAPVAPPPPARGETRIEMDAADLKGQRHAYGMIELKERKDLAVRSMVKARESFRDEIQ